VGKEIKLVQLNQAAVKSVPELKSKRENEDKPVQEYHAN
jgi:hypothetical protein